MQRESWEQFQVKFIKLNKIKILDTICFEIHFFSLICTNYVILAVKMLTPSNLMGPGATQL